MKTAAPDVSLKNLTLDAVRSLSQSRNEPGWAIELRELAWKNFEALPWPGPRDEKWKRFELDSVAWDKFSPAVNRDANTLSDADLDKIAGGATALQNGHAASSARFVIDADNGAAVRLGSLGASGAEWIPFSEAIAKRPEQIRAAWKAAIEKSATNKVSSLTLALVNNGHCLIVKDNAQISAPLQISILSGGAAAPFFFNFVSIGRNAEVQLWEQLTGRDGAETFVAGHTHIFLAEGAKASLYTLQQWNAVTTHLQFLTVSQAASSRFNAVTIATGGRRARTECVIDLNGAGAENKILGVSFGSADQYFENWVTQNHVAPKTTSDIQFRSALKGRSRSFFAGMVNIEKTAQQSDAYQSSKALLLSKDAKADAIPNLEILADDVKCSHGAAVGPVDEDQKYYLQTRGVPPEIAEDIIVEGFFEPVIAEIPSESVQEKLRAFIDEKLHGDE